MNTCTLCGHALLGGRALWTTCQACQNGIEALLDSIETRWPQLADCLEPVRGHSGPRVSGTAAPASLVADHVLALYGPLGVPTRLYHRYAALAVSRRIQPARMPSGEDHRVRLALYGIRKHLPWAVQGASLAELRLELVAIDGDLARVTAAAGPSPSVPCPAQLPDGATCTGRLRYDDAQRTAACRTCRTVLDPSEWLDAWIKHTAAA